MKVKSFIKIVVSTFMVITIRSLSSGKITAILSLILCLFGIGVCWKNFSVNKEEVDNSRYKKYHLFWRVLKSLGEANQNNYLTKIFLHASMYLFIVIGFSSVVFLINNYLFSLIMELAMTIYGLFFTLIAFTYLMKPVYERITPFKALLFIIAAITGLTIIGSLNYESISGVVPLFVAPLTPLFSVNFVSVILKRNVEEEELTEKAKLKMKALQFYVPFILPSLVFSFMLTEKIPEEVLQIISNDDKVFSLGLMRVLIFLLIFGLSILSFTIFRDRKSIWIQEKTQNLIRKKNDLK